MRGAPSQRACPKAERPMFKALSDFVIYCRVERRLADLTCKAMSATCARVYSSCALTAPPRSRRCAPPTSDVFSRMRPRTARRPRASHARWRRCAASFASASRANTWSAIPHRCSARPRSAKRYRTCSMERSSRGCLTCPGATPLDSHARRQGPARPSAARAVGLRRAAPLRAPGSRLGRSGPDSERFVGAVAWGPRLAVGLEATWADDTERTRSAANSQLSRDASWVATRRAQAMTVSIGLTPSDVGKMLESAMYRPGRSCASPDAATAPRRGSASIRAVPIG